MLLCYCLLIDWQAPEKWAKDFILVFTAMVNSFVRRQKHRRNNNPLPQPPSLCFLQTVSLSQCRDLGHKRVFNAAVAR